MLVFRDIAFEEISLIKELWECNRRYHQNISISFGDLYKDLIFEDRMMGFAAFDHDKIKITHVEDDISYSVLWLLYLSNKRDMRQSSNASCYRRIPWTWHRQGTYAWSYAVV